MFHAAVSLIFMLISLMAGIYLATNSNMSVFGDPNWKTAFAAMATLCLGFGAATFVHWRIRDRQVIDLQSRFDALSVRADALADKLRSTKRSERLSS